MFSGLNVPPMPIPERDTGHRRRARALPLVRQGFLGGRWLHVDEDFGRFESRRGNCAVGRQTQKRCDERPVNHGGGERRHKRRRGERFQVLTVTGHAIVAARRDAGSPNASVREAGDGAEFSPNASVREAGDGAEFSPNAFA